MALRGNLKDFSLPDVFQLVTFSRKTGVLRIKRADGAEGSVWFRDGDVFFASSNWHNEPLGERLVKAERITPQALSRALETRSREGDSGRRLGQILIDEGYITDKVLEDFVGDQIQDTIFDLMRWDEGDFDFEAMPDVVEEDIGLTVSIENVVMEGARRLEEWSRIKKKIPSMDVVFKMATAPGEGTFEISLKPMEWQLLLLIDSTRSVAELAVETDRTDFEVARIVYGLFSAGLLEFATEEEIEHNRAERAEREAKLAVIEAERAKAAEAEQAAALEREAKLATEAEERRRAQEVAVQAAQPIARTEPEEEPEFLGGSVSAPSSQDQSVLEEFMGVLRTPAAAEDAPAPVEPAPVSQPHVPAEEPAFMSVDHAEESEMVVPVASVEDLLGFAPVAPSVIEPEPLAPSEGEIEPYEPELEPYPEVPEPELPEGIEGVELVSIAEPTFEEPAVAEPQAEPEFVEEPADQEIPAFEDGLMALGLGEMPADLLSPVGAEPAEEPQAPEIVIESEAPAELEFELEPVAEPMSEMGMADWMGMATPSEEVAEEPAADDFRGLATELELPSVMPQETFTEQQEQEAEEPDFSDLLQSLDVDADVVTEVRPEPEAEPEDAGFDLDLLREAEPVETGGVISTDAFLEDIEEDLGDFSGGLTDELSALTGAERRGVARPQASVNAIPDSGSVLHRDARVDKDTLLKIIDGIKNL